MSDDPRFGLRPLTIDIEGKPLSIRLNVAWNPHATAADTVRGVAHRLADWVGQHYGTATRLH